MVIGGQPLYASWGQETGVGIEGDHEGLGIRVGVARKLRTKGWLGAVLLYIYIYICPSSSLFY